MAKLIEGSAWTVIPEAAALHQRGLNKEVETEDYAGAHGDFANALDILGHENQTPDVELQTARVIRDDGFTHIREALVPGQDLWSLDALRAASVKLHNSLNITNDLLADETADPKRLKELLSEHGATLGCLGRMAVASQVKVGMLPYKANEDISISEVRAAQYYFGKREAHKYLKAGSNMYYLVNNAMQGVRAERLNGKLAHAGVWAGRAALGLMHAKGKLETVGTIRQELANRRTTDKSVSRALMDGTVRTEFGHSLLTMIRLGKAALTKKSAAASVLARP